jgi:hypothetical protein
MSPKTQPVTIRLKTKLIENMKAIARNLSAKHGKDISYTDLMRRAIHEKYDDGAADAAIWCVVNGE